MSFSQAVRHCLNNYAKFDGRATRPEFWWFYLFVVIVSAVGYIPFLIFTLIAGAAGDGSAIATLFLILAIIWVILWIVAYLGLIVPLLAVGSRRLHDRGQSGWLQLLLLVPCGNLVLLIFWLLEGTPGDNAYGSKPV